MWTGSPSRIAAALTALAVALAVVDDGGYGAGSRVRFSVFALLAAAAAAAADPVRARRLAREPVFAVLVVLGILGGLSAAWTKGLEDDALRWGLVTGAYAAVAFAAAVLAPRVRAVEAAAALVAMLAVAMGLVGLVAAAVTDEPLAHRAAGLWRPAAPFQYSPALALLVVSALPPLLAAMVGARRWWTVLGAGAGGAVAGATLALAESRTQLAFALIVAAAALAHPGLLRASRPAVTAALALMAAVGLGAYAVNGGYVPVTPPPDGTARLLALLAVLAAGAVAWLAVSAALRRRVPPAALAALLLAVGGAGAIAKPPAKLISAGIVGKAKPRPVHRSSEPRTNHAIRDRLLHGRLHLWGEALETFADRPLYGGGADAYWFASADHQGTKTTFYAHALPLELAAELGIAGLLLSLGLYAAAGRALWRGRAGPAAWLLGPAAAAFLAANLVDWPWHLAGSGAVWALALGAMIGTRGATREGF